MSHGYKIEYDQKSMGNSTGQTLDNAKHTNTMTNEWTKWTGANG